MSQPQPPIGPGNQTPPTGPQTIPPGPQGQPGQNWPGAYAARPWDSPKLRRRNGRASLVWAVILILLGVFSLIQNLGLLSWWRWDILWPLVLVGLGVWLLVWRFFRQPWR